MLFLLFLLNLTVYIEYLNNSERKDIETKIWLSKCIAAKKCIADLNLFSEDPKIVEEAIKSDNVNECRAAMNEEMQWSRNCNH